MKIAEMFKNTFYSLCSCSTEIFIFMFQSHVEDDVFSLKFFVVPM